MTEGRELEIGTEKFLNGVLIFEDLEDHYE